MSIIIMDNDVQNLVDAMRSLAEMTVRLNANIENKSNDFQTILQSLNKSISSTLVKGGEKNTANIVQETTPKRVPTKYEQALKTRQEDVRYETEIEDIIIKYPADYTEALKGANYRLEREFGSTFKNMQNLVYNSSIAMRESMSTFFFDAMTGKLKTAEEYFKSFLTSIQKAIAQFLANEITNKLITTLFGNLLGDGNTNNKMVSLSERDKYPSITITKAAGGHVAAGNQLIAGESGPELINLDGAGATVISNNTTQSMLAGQNNLAVEVNVINQSGTQMQASQGESRFDGMKMVA